MHQILGKYEFDYRIVTNVLHMMRKTYPTFDKKD
jgi:hypothetical protein